jgi:hypothetical protein
VDRPATDQQSGDASYPHVVTRVPTWRERLDGGATGLGGMGLGGWAFTVVSALVCLVAFAALPGTYADNTAMREAPVCAEPVSGPASSPDCLAEVPGRITDQRTGSGRHSGGSRWEFTPAVTGFDTRWVRLHGDRGTELWSPAVAEVISGRTVTALYWKDDPVEFVTDDGTVETTAFLADAWTALLWVGIAALALAVMRPMAGRLDGRSPRETGPTSRGARTLRAMVGLTPVLVLLGAIAAVFPDRLGGQVLVFACTVGAGLLVVAASGLRRSVGRRP